MMPFYIQRWIWIFIFQSLLVQPSFAYSKHDILARKVIDNLFHRGLSKAEKTRNIYIAVAITAVIVLVVGLVGLFLFIRKRRQVFTEPEAGADHKPSWWMVDGKAEKKDWWRLGHTQASSPTEPLGSDGRSRTQRLKAALGLRFADQPILPTHRGTITSPPLPMQTNPNLRPRYPESLERGGTWDPAPSLPQIPTIAIHSADQHLECKLSAPPRALTSSSSRSTSKRRVHPRSPAAGRRRSRSLTQPIRNPFLPLRESEVPASQSAALKAGDASDSQNSHPYSTGSHETPLPSLQSSSPGRRNPPPALQLKQPETPRSGRKVRFGLPRSPRPLGIQ